MGRDDRDSVSTWPRVSRVSLELAISAAIATSGVAKRSLVTLSSLSVNFWSHDVRYPVWPEDCRREYEVEAFFADPLDSSGKRRKFLEAPALGNVEFSLQAKFHDTDL